MRRKGGGMYRQNKSKDESANPAEHFTNWQSMQVQKDEKKAEDNAGSASLRRAKQAHQVLEGKEKKQRTKGRL
jgi:hypothetical protein